MIYLHQFENNAGYADGDVHIPDVSLIKSDNGVKFQDYSKVPLTFQIIGEEDYEEGDTYTITLAFDSQDTTYERRVKYRINHGEWFQGLFGGTAISGLVPGDLVEFWSPETQAYAGGQSLGSQESPDWFNYFGCDTTFNLFGNIDSLNNYRRDTYASGQYAHLFYDCGKLRSAENLIFTDGNLNTYCYFGMFRECSGMTVAPELPSVDLEEGCYMDMFVGCKNLVRAPELLAESLPEHCYAAMFYGCTNLGYVKCLAEEFYEGNETTNWLGNVATTGTFAKNPNTPIDESGGSDGWRIGRNGIPSGWTVINA